MAAELTLQCHCVLESNPVTPGNAIDLDMSVALDRNSDRLIVLKPGIEGGEGGHVFDLDGLANVDGL